VLALADWLRCWQVRAVVMEGHVGGLQCYDLDAIPDHL
jgi:hypothetical protein